MAEGFIVGCDLFQEWLLPWWWENYRRHNRYPVAFFDFGLSEKGKKWCLERGALIQLRSLLVKGREEVHPSLTQQWEELHGEHFWNSREAWFKKPLACVRSPFQKSVWLDLDCEVLQPLDFLFETCLHPSGLAIVKDQIAPTYNSGVIAFRQDCSILQAWADQALEKTGDFRGDQDLLSHIIAEKNAPICELESIYNWNVGCGDHPEMAIRHWLGEAAKNALRNQLILNDL